MPDTYDKLGILGERSVMRVLLQHSFRNLRAAGIKEYTIYSTRGTALQKKEVDIIEKWIDASGKMHTKGHEVKCEKTTLDYDTSNKSKAERMELEAAFVTGAPDVSKEHWTCKPTGNYFIELVQSVTKEQAESHIKEYNKTHSALDVTRDNGWYPAFEEAAAVIEDSFTEGRDIWFVSYTPKPKRKKIKDEQTGEVYYVKPTEPARGFIVMQLPDDGGHDQLYKYVYGETLKASKAENTHTGLWSMGLLLPIKKLYPCFPIGENERIVSGCAHRKSGAVLYNDLAVWANEKGLWEKWTKEDTIIEPFAWKNI